MGEQMTAYKNMVGLLDVDTDTADRLNSCISDPRTYYEEHEGLYAERGMYSKADDDTVIWLGMVDILIEQGLMFEFDWKAELEDFLYGMEQIIPGDTLTLDGECFDEDADITQWLKALHDPWMEQGYVIAGMDIDSDSYCVMITARDAFDRLAAEAGKTGHRIALAQDM
ncbi:MAG: hypothetical protein NC121_18985 [Blautia sp.]|nr:hypothetical protein [Blautia sp.]